MARFTRKDITHVDMELFGGGIYEDHEFLDFCDENGILIWQDFMFACEFPPKDEAFLKECYNEAVFIIKKYRNHPSLALWCGDNENDMFWNTWKNTSAIQLQIDP